MLYESCPVVRVQAAWSPPCTKAGTSKVSLPISSALQFAIYSSSQAPSSEPGFGESLCTALHLSLGFISCHPATQWSLSANRSKGCSGLTLPLKSRLLMILFPFCFEDLLISFRFFFLPACIFKVFCILLFCKGLCW